MKTATQNLEQDHINILRLTDIMEQMVLGKSTNMEHFETVVHLIRNYADGFHHAKEEKLLFPLLVQKGFSMDQGPVGMMLYEHDLGRNFVQGIADGIAEYRDGDTEALSSIYKNAQGYCDLLRSHISKENNILFRMADKAITEQDQEVLLKDFSRVEESVTSEGKLQEYLSSIDQLESIYQKGNSNLY